MLLTGINRTASFRLPDQGPADFESSHLTNPWGAVSPSGPGPESFGGSDERSGQARKVMGLVTGVEVDQWGTSCPGAIHDTQTWSNILAGTETTVLTNSQATKQNILQGIQNAAQQLNAGDQFVLTFASHGGGIPDQNGDEVDGQDEVMMVYDGELVDDELWDALSQFKEGVQVVVASDTCESGTNADIEKAGAGDANFIQISGSTDSTNSKGGSNGGKLTNAIGQVVEQGNYQNFNDFFQQVYNITNQTTNGYQTPQMTYGGPSVQTFLNSTPFDFSANATFGQGPAGSASTNGLPPNNPSMGGTTQAGYDPYQTTGGNNTGYNNSVGSSGWNNGYGSGYDDYYGGGWNNGYGSGYDDYYGGGWNNGYGSGYDDYYGGSWNNGYDLGYNDYYGGWDTGFYDYGYYDPVYYDTGYYDTGYGGCSDSYGYDWCSSPSYTYSYDPFYGGYQSYDYQSYSPYDYQMSYGWDYGGSYYGDSYYDSGYYDDYSYYDYYDPYQYF